MITPSKTCQGKPFSADWIKIVDNPTFSTAVEQAMLELVIQQNNMPDMATAAAAGWKIQGAKQFLKILMELGTKPKMADVKPNSGIDYSK